MCDEDEREKLKEMMMMEGRAVKGPGGLGKVWVVGNLIEAS
jgi:hypothetical protein